MLTANEKIGQLISQVRQERGLTQAEFARRLNTSQSAVNRMERGRQNLSLDTLGRISDVLNKPLISVGNSSVNLRVEGGYELHGTIDLKTSKNATVGLLAASLLNQGTTKLKNAPHIEEVNRIVEVLESIGVKICWLPNNTLEIKPPAKPNLDNINADSARKTRSVLMFIGPLMHVFDNFRTHHMPVVANSADGPYCRTFMRLKKLVLISRLRPDTTTSMLKNTFLSGRWCYTNRETRLLKTLSWPRPNSRARQL